MTKMQSRELIATLLLPERQKKVIAMSEKINAQRAEALAEQGEIMMTDSEREFCAKLRNLSPAKLADVERLLDEMLGDKKSKHGSVSPSSEIPVPCAPSAEMFLPWTESEKNRLNEALDTVLAPRNNCGGKSS